MSWRSRGLLGNLECTLMRFLYRSLGYSEEAMRGPLIGIANAWNSINPGHYNLKEVAEAAQRGILQAGGMPLEFGTIGPCDGIARAMWVCAIFCLPAT